MAAIIRVRNENGAVIEIPAIVGPKGDKGDSYVLTEADKNQLVQMVIDALGGGLSVL